MTAVFFYGTLRHRPLLDLVLGHAARTENAVLDGHILRQASGADHPAILPLAGAEAAGLLLVSASDEDLARLDYYQNGFAYQARPVLVRPIPTPPAGEGPPQGSVLAKCYFTGAGQAVPDTLWDFAGWQARYGAVKLAVAAERMAAYGTERAAVVQGRVPMLEVRAAARLRAQAEPAPARVRHDAGPQDVDVAQMQRPYEKFFAVEEYDLRHRRFSGTMTGVLNRAAFVSGDAAVVLPYDPVRDRVLVIEQFRPGPYARGDRQPWQLEPIAGRVDAGETPEEAARREAVEEAGIVLAQLLPIAHYYPSPGAKTEYLYTFLALADLPDVAENVAGLEAEGEDIRAHRMPFDRLMALIASGEVATGPLILSALWLAARRAGFRAAAGADVGPVAG